MARTLRSIVKENFDGLMYRYAWLNRIARNLNKGISGYTSFQLRPFGTLRLKLKSGLEFKLATNHTSALSKKLFWNTPDQYEYTRIFEKLVMKCKVFADIGANIGYYSLVAAKANPFIKVYAFEPAPGPYHYLEKNVALNALGSRIEIFRLALSDKSGNLEFQEIGYTGNNRESYNLGGAGKLITRPEAKATIIPVLVPSETADTFFKVRTPFPDLIKMDTEGTEHLIIKGAQEVIRKHKPIIICETLFGVIESELDAVMRSHGYHFYNFLNGKLIRVESLLRSEDNGVSDCFFVHPEKAELVREFM